MSRERLDDRRDGVLRRPREGREIGHLVRDLRPRRRDEMIEEPGGDLLLLRPESVDRAFEMIRDDLARSAELVQRGNPQGARSSSALDVPQALHDELEVRGFDPRSGAPFPSTAPTPPGPSSIRPTPTPSRTRSTRASSARTSSPSSSFQRRSGPTIAARPAARSSRSSRSTFEKSCGMSALRRSRLASVSSRSESSTLTRSGRFTAAASASSNGPRLSWYVKYSSAWSRIR